MQGKFGVVLGVLGIVLALVAFVGPWWTVNTEASVLGFSAKGSAEFRLFGGTTTIQSSFLNQTNTTDYRNEPQTGSVFFIGAMFTALALLLGVGMVSLAALSGPRPSFRRLGALLGILAFLLALVAPLYVMAQLPNAVNQDSGAGTGLTTISGFWGSQSSTFFGASANVSWAAGWAWFVVLIAAVLFLVGSLGLFRSPAPAAQPPSQPSPPPQ